MPDTKAVSLKGKVAIVTGGGSGIGQGIAMALANFGAKVVIAERDEHWANHTASQIRENGGESIACIVDVQQKEQVDLMVETTLSEFGCIDTLVNNVGGFLGIVKPFVNTTEEDWEGLYGINLKHVFYCTRAVVPHMLERGEGGSVINLSTIEAFRGIPNLAVYSAFNAAITGFTKSLALELAPDKIRVNAIAPETTDTPQTALDTVIPEDKKKYVPYWIPLGRFGRPEDAGGCAVFLASDLSSWVTGTTIHLDGGALAAGGFYRVPDGGWTNMPIVTGAAFEF